MPGVLTDEIQARLTTEIKAAVEDATDYAEAQPDPDPAGAMRYVYADVEGADGPEAADPARGHG